MNWYKVAQCDFSRLYHATAGDNAYGWGKRVDYLVFVSPVQIGDARSQGSAYRATLIQTEIDPESKDSSRILKHTYVDDCNNTEEIIAAAASMSGLPAERWEITTKEKMTDLMAVNL